MYEKRIITSEKHKCVITKVETCYNNMLFTLLWIKTHLLRWMFLYILLTFLRHEGVWWGKCDTIKLHFNFSSHYFNTSIRYFGQKGCAHSHARNFLTTIWKTTATAALKEDTVYAEVKAILRRAKAAREDRNTLCASRNSLNLSVYLSIRSGAPVCLKVSQVSVLVFPSMYLSASWSTCLLA